MNQAIVYILKFNISYAPEKYFYHEKITAIFIFFKILTITMNVFVRKE